MILKATTAPAESMTQPSMMDIIKGFVTVKNATKTFDGLRQKSVTLMQQLATRQGISAEEALVLSAMICKYVSGKMSLEEIGEHLHCNEVETLELISVVEALEEKGYIRNVSRFQDSDQYAVNTEIIKSYSSNRPYKPQPLTCPTDRAFLRKLDKIVKFNPTPSDRFVMEQERLFEENEGLPMLEKIRSMGLTETQDYLIIVHLCRLLVLRDNLHVNIYELDEFSPSTMDLIDIVLSEYLENSDYVLFKKGIIEYCYADGMRDTSSVQLTKKTIKTLLPNYKVKLDQQEMNAATVIEPRSIVSKDLFYDAECSKQVDRLTHLLEEKNYKQIKQRLRQKGLREGFCVLLYGASGAGKTETVLQLAKKTHRKVVQVNLSQLRSMWVGESEKNLQGIFTDYAELMRTSTYTPILLFNEGDGILNTRNDNPHSAVDKMENTLQNIVLQAMETFQGIMIVTTNLQSVLDKAFSRRFIFQIKFNKPDESARANILHSMLPDLPEDTVTAIAHSYRLTGGQIENIRRTITVDDVLYGIGTPTLQQMRTYCQQEMGGENGTNKVGFN